MCYSCDAKWQRGHVYQVPKLFLIEVAKKDGEVERTAKASTKEDPGEFFLEEFLKITLNAITRTLTPKTMRIVGFLRFNQVIILIDFGVCMILLTQN